MRFVVLLMTSALVAAAGCAQAPSDDAATSDDSALTGGTGPCRVMHEDAEIVVLRSPDGKTMYAAKQMHVTDLRITPATVGIADLQSTRFGSSHVAYTLVAKPRPESLIRLGQLIGPNTPMATVTMASDGAGVDTLIRPVASSYTTNADGSLTADLVDAVSPTPETTPFYTSATTKALLTTAHANGTISCGGATIPLAVTAASPVVFDITQAKILTPGDDLSAIGTFLATADAIKTNQLSGPLGQVNDPTLNAKMAAFASTVDTEIRPLSQQYGVSMSRTDLKTHVQNAYNAYRDLMASVLSATKASANVDNVQTKSASGWSFATGTPDAAQQLLPTANTLRDDVEGVLADASTGWTLKDLK